MPISAPFNVVQKGTTLGATSVTTPSISLTAGNLLLAVVGSRTTGTVAGSLATFSIGNGTLTGVGAWTEIDQQGHDAAVDTQIAAFWTRVGASNTSGTVVASASATVTEWNVVLFEVTGAAASGDIKVQSTKAVASGITTTPTLTLLNAPAAGNLVLGFLLSRAEIDGITPGTGYTELYDGAAGAGDAWLNIQYRLDAATQTVDWSDANTARNVAIAIEVAAAASATPIVGTAAMTLGAVTVASTGKLAVAGTASLTVANVTVAAAAKLQIAASASLAVASITASSTGTLAIAGQASITLASVTSSATAALAIAGQAALTLGDIASSATGQLAIVGAFTGTLDAVTINATGQLAIAGALAGTLDAVTLAATGELAPLAGTGSLAVTLDAVTVTATATLAITGTSSLVLADVTSEATGTLAIVGAMSATLADVTLVATGTTAEPGLTGSLAATLEAVTVVSTGSLAIAAIMAVILADVTISATGELTGEVVILPSITYSAEVQINFIVSASVAVL